MRQNSVTNRTVGRRRWALGGLFVATTVALTACGGASSNGTPTTGALTKGADIYTANCATCHGAKGQGFVGPQLAGRMQTAYPNIDDQILVVTEGRLSMPAWKGKLTAQQIRAVVEYTRTDLGH